MHVCSYVYHCAKCSKCAHSAACTLAVCCRLQQYRLFTFFPRWVCIPFNRHFLLGILSGCLFKYLPWYSMILTIVFSRYVILVFCCGGESWKRLLLLLLLSWSWLSILSYFHSMFIYIVDLFFSVCENLCDRQLLLLLLLLLIFFILILFSQSLEVLYRFAHCNRNNLFASHCYWCVCACVFFDVDMFVVFIRATISKTRKNLVCHKTSILNTLGWKNTPNDFSVVCVLPIPHTPPPPRRPLSTLFSFCW